MIMSTLTFLNSENIKRIFEAQRISQYKIAESTPKERIQKLRRMSDVVLKYRDEIREALYKDYRRPPAEVDLIEIFPITSNTKHTIKHLRRWTKPWRVPTPLSLFGSSSWIQHEPKGVCLIIGPWNYPIQLMLEPLIYAIAAGNTAILKPSEFMPNSSAVVKKIVGKIFPEEEVAVIEGGIAESTALLDLPFNHIHFTGSPEVGKIVMSAAAKNLASVTLELGGKSTAIVDETADLQIAALRISIAKFANCGQTCIAPDYILVHQSKRDALVEVIKKRIEEFYGTIAQDSESYMRLVNERNFLRVKSYIDDAIQSGAKVVHGGGSVHRDLYIEPTVVVDVPTDSSLMQNEIFGPVLPVIAYDHLEDAIEFIRSGQKPLGLYIYSKNKKNINTVLQATRAGGSCINHSAVHFFNSNLPFGGSNNSGIGKTHGIHGFKSFTNERAVYRQNLPSVLDKLVPPYTAVKLKIIDFTIKWF